MSDIKISELGLVQAVGTTDVLPIVQNGVTVKVTGQEIADSVKAMANLANEAYVNTAIDNLVNGAPGMLDTLKELADAIGNDPNFYNDLMSALNNKLNDTSFQEYFDIAFAGKNTYHLTEGSNLYFTTARARNSFSAGNGITITNGQISSNIVSSDNEVIIANSNGHGGTGYAGMLTLTNNSSGASNIHKFIRLNNTGALEIVNSAYSATVFAVTDGGQAQLGAGGLRFNDGTTMTTASSGSGNSSPTRTTVSVTTGSLTANSSATANLTGAKGYALLGIQTSAGAWVTVYSSNAARTADASRAITTDPTPGSGILAEFISTTAGTQYFTPATIGFSTENPPTTNIPLKIVNNSGATNTITVTLTYLPLEA